MEENFCIAAFRSRQQVMAYDHALRLLGAHPAIITTPRAVSTGCGLSVRFAPAEWEKARAAYQRMPPGNLVGFYRVVRDDLGRTIVRPLNIRS